MQDKQGFKYIKDSYGKYIFTKQHQLSNGQVILMEFEETGFKKKIVYNVVLTISNKKKRLSDYDENKTTGKCGLEGLLWGKRTILDFEKYILKEKSYDKRKIYIEVMWSDNRRRNAYIRGLKSNGYNISKLDGFKCLLKQIK